jgi:hypothetical protein
VKAPETSNVPLRRCVTPHQPRPRRIRFKPHAFRKFKLAENQWEDTTPLGLVIIGDLTRGSSQARHPGLIDGVLLELGMGISERH